VQRLALTPGNALCDIPGGGGYLADYIHDCQVCFHFLETSHEFATQCPRSSHHRVIECALEGTLPLADNSMDRVLSLAALHHVNDKPGIYREFKRILRPGGKLVIADVERGSDTAHFLNEFVDRYNSMGHCGVFLDADDLLDISRSGLEVTAVERPPISWSFASQADLADFCRQLFGLDLASTTDILAGVTHYLKLSDTGAGCTLQWQLTYVTAQA